MHLTSPVLRRCLFLGLVTCTSLAMPNWAFAGDPPGLVRAIAAQERHTAALLKRPGVVGTAVGLTTSGAPAITIYTERIGIGGLPQSLDGFDVMVKVTGKILPLHHCKGAHASDPSCESPPGDEDPTSSGEPTDRFDRPVPIGVSAGNVESITTDGIFISCSTGTLGARLLGGSTGYALSNNHVFALSNEATANSDIVQPGPADAEPVCADHSGADTIGTLYDYEPIVFSTEANNTLDAAIALEDPANSIGKATPADGYGMPRTVPLNCDEAVSCANLLNQAVQKYGRTTGLTKGVITGVNAIIHVGYNSGTARFVDQIEVSGRGGGFIKSGDSGSLLVTDPGRQPVGLLFAGDRGGKTGFANRMDLVLTRFGKTIDGE
jgi:hypothetical protein